VPTTVGAKVSVFPSDDPSGMTASETRMAQLKATAIASLALLGHFCCLKPI
jgi:hypothetical protein